MTSVATVSSGNWERSVFLLAELAAGTVACLVPIVWSQTLTNGSLLKGLMLASIILVPLEGLRQIVGVASLRAHIRRLAADLLGRRSLNGTKASEVGLSALAAELLEHLEALEPERLTLQLLKVQEEVRRGLKAQREVTNGLCDEVSRLSDGSSELLEAALGELRAIRNELELVARVVAEREQSRHERSGGKDLWAEAWKPKSEWQSAEQGEVKSYPRPVRSAIEPHGIVSLQDESWPLEPLQGQHLRGGGEIWLVVWHQAIFHPTGQELRQTRVDPRKLEAILRALGTRTGR